MPRFIAILPLLVLFACTNSPAEPATPIPPPPPVYYFYPKANVYFDTVNKDYLFLGNDGITWTTGKQIPAVVQSLMDKRVMLDSAATPVWKQNAEHRLVYSALLYASPEDTVVKKEPPPVTKAPTNSDTVKKEKKGLGKFFERIFGKKKKEKE